MTTTIDEQDATNVVELRPRAGTAAGPTSPEVDREPAPDEVDGFAPALEHQLEALLFVSPTPLTSTQLAELTEEDEDDVQDCLLDMMSAWAEGARGIVLERVAGGWAMRASDRCATQLRRLTRPQGDTRLSASAVETLSIIAYLQPVSRPDLARIRGVSVDAAVNGLLERGFVEEAGRGDTGAVLFRTTAHFERAFGLASLGSLPPLEGFGPGADEITRMREQLERMADARVE